MTTAVADTPLGQAPGVFETVHIKMDVEGAEALVPGAKATLVERLPTLFISTHGPQVHRECMELLRALPYEVESAGGTGSEGFELVAQPARAPT